MSSSQVGVPQIGSIDESSQSNSLQCRSKTADPPCTQMSSVSQSSCSLHSDSSGLVGRRRGIFRKVRRHVRRRLGGKESALLVLYTLGLLISSCGNSIFFK